jgi:uncharacterized protein YktA (UPF0223 family)
MLMTMRWLRWTVGLSLLAAFLVVMPADNVRADCFEDEEYAEAVKQAEDQWKAVRQTMQDGVSRYEEFLKNYEKYKNIVFSQDMEKSIILVKRIFGMSNATEQQAKDMVWKLRDQFNRLDKAGLKGKLQSAIGQLKKADKIAGELENTYQFAQKFDPANAKDNPTYGLKLIGNTLADGAKKIEAVPLVGKVLGPWFSAYAEATQAFVGALDRLTAKIKDFRQGSLCAQFGKNTDARAAFDAATQTARYRGEDCLTYFPVAHFPRLRGMAFRGQDNYYLFNPVGCRGYFAPAGNTDKVYRWHALLLSPRALDPAWLADRARSLTTEVEQRARRHYRLFQDLHNHLDDGWALIEELVLTGDVAYYAALPEETFVANYIIDDQHNKRIDDVLNDYQNHVLAEGRVFGRDHDGERPLGGAQVVFRLQGKAYRTQTDLNGRYQLLMKGQAANRMTIEATAVGYEPYRADGAIPGPTILGNDIFLVGIAPAGDSDADDQDGDEEVPAFITRSKPQPSETEPAPETDDGPDDVRAVATETETVGFNGVVLERIINEDSLTVVRRVDGEDKMLTGKAAVDVLLKEGYLQQVKGIGLVATERFERFMQEGSPGKRGISTEDLGKIKNASRSAKWDLTLNGRRCYPQNLITPTPEEYRHYSRCDKLAKDLGF